MEENIIQDRACLDLDRYWSKTHFLRPLVGDSIRSYLVIPHIAILPHCLTLPYLWLFADNIRFHLVIPHIARDDVLLIETLPDNLQLWRKSFLVSQIFFLFLRHLCINAIGSLRVSASTPVGPSVTLLLYQSAA